MTCFFCGLKTTDAKAPICKNVPCQICKTLAEVDEEIDQTVASLRRLLSRRYDILSEHNRVHGLIHRLPVELKNRIFELLLPPQNEWGEIYGTGMRSFLSTISLCKGWRDIALSNPFLWSKMHIDLRTSNPSSRINDWVHRSRTLPLTLYIQVRNSMVEPEQVLDALSRCSNRLQSLSLYYDSDALSPDDLLGGLKHNGFQYHCLTQLRVLIGYPQFNRPLSFLNSTASPEKIEVMGMSFPSLQISWNRLVSAAVYDFDLEDVAQLFQHAPQMTFCRLSSLKHGPRNFSMPPIIHHSLITLDLDLYDWGVAPGPLDSLTLPCLQEVVIFETPLLIQLPALVRRSSCPLTKLAIKIFQYEDEFPFNELQPLPGLTDLVIEVWNLDIGTMMKLLLEGFFPDLRHLTLLRQPFEVLWDTGAIPLLLNRKRPQPDGPNEGVLRKFTVVGRGPVSEFDSMWEDLKKLNVTRTEDGFEFF